MNEAAVSFFCLVVPKMRTSAYVSDVSTASYDIKTAENTHLNTATGVTRSYMSFLLIQ